MKLKIFTSSIPEQYRQILKISLNVNYVPSFEISDDEYLFLKLKYPLVILEYPGEVELSRVNCYEYDYYIEELAMVTLIAQNRLK